MSRMRLGSAKTDALRISVASTSPLRSRRFGRGAGSVRLWADASNRSSAPAIPTRCAVPTVRGASTGAAIPGGASAELTAVPGAGATVAGAGRTAVTRGPAAELAPVAASGVAAAEVAPVATAGVTAPVVAAIATAEVTAVATAGIPTAVATKVATVAASGALGPPVASAALVAAALAATQRLAARAGDEIDIEPEASHAAADAIFRTLFSIPIEDEIATRVFNEFREHQRTHPASEAGGEADAAGRAERHVRQRRRQLRQCIGAA